MAIRSSSTSTADDGGRIADYDPAWVDEFATIGAALRTALGEMALRIDHIGSTSIVGLGAKPIVDVQVSVGTLEPMSYREPIESLGYVWRHDNPEKPNATSVNHPARSARTFTCA